MLPAPSPHPHLRHIRCRPGWGGGRSPRYPRIAADESVVAGVAPGGPLPGAPLAGPGAGPGPGPGRPVRARPRAGRRGPPAGIVLADGDAAAVLAGDQWADVSTVDVWPGAGAVPAGRGGLAPQ